MKKKAIAAGHICIDITPVFQEDAPRYTDLGDILKPGKLIQMSAPDVHTGGSVANTGLGMMKLGADVSLMGKVGDDSFGGMVKDILMRYGAGDNLITVPGETTSYSVVIAAPGIDRVFLHCPGANDTFDGTEIPEAALEDVALFHFGYPTLMKMMYREDGRNLESLFRRMKDKGIATSLDMAAVDPESEAGRADWEKILGHVLPLVDFFVPSFEELCFMLDRSRYDELIKEAGKSDVTSFLSVERDVRPLAEKCLKLGARAVLIKCGAPGLFLLTSDKMSETGERLGLDAGAWDGFCEFEPSFKVEHVVSGTGAGDTCIAAFLTSILEGMAPKLCLENAAAAGALCCMSVDALSGLKPLSEIRQLIEAGWELSTAQ